MKTWRHSWMPNLIENNLNDVSFLVVNYYILLSELKTVYQMLK